MASIQEGDSVGSIGLQLYSVNAEMLADTPSTLRQIAAVGYSKVETAGLGSLKTAKEFRAELNANGLTCPSAHVQFDLNNLGSTFEEANTLGCIYATTSVPRMLLWPPVSDPYSLPPDQMLSFANRILAPMSADEFKRTAEALNHVGLAARQSGLTLAAHNHTMELVPLNGKTGWDYLIENTDPNLVKFQLDCGWSSILGFDPVTWMDRYPGRITMLHIKDFAPYSGTEPPTFMNIRGMELGAGSIDYNSLLGRLKNRDITHIFVEQDGPFDRMGALKSAEVNLTYLKSIFNASNLVMK
jgi:sugar phosphate isomerase/epimerase